jgi:hypothetical protein
MTAKGSGTAVSEGSRISRRAAEKKLGFRASQPLSAGHILETISLKPEVL